MSFTMQMQPSLFERPSIYDLYTIDLNGSDMWYKVGIELNIGEDVLDRIKLESTKLHLCKRAMFKEWLRVSPDESCTYYHLIQALSKVDKKMAETVYQTVATDSEEMLYAKKPNTAQLPIHHEYDSGLKRVKEKVSSASGDYFREKLVSMVAPPPPASGQERKPHTEIVHRDRDSLSPIGTTSQSITRLNNQLPLEGSLLQSRVQGDYASSNLASSDHVKGSEVCLESSHESEQADEIRSVSAEAYQTASEDESILVFSYQHDGQAGGQTSNARESNKVCTKSIHL